MAPTSRSLLSAAVLIGGRSERMGRPKHLLRDGDKTWLERTVDTLGEVCRRVVLVGDGHVPATLGAVGRLTDVTDARGPMAGVLAAMRSDRDAAWLVCACDFPRLSVDAVRWLVGERRPERAGIVPTVRGPTDLQPLFAVYEPALLPYFEASAAQGLWRMLDVGRAPAVCVLAAPPALRDALTNVNEPGELA